MKRKQDIYETVQYPNSAAVDVAKDEHVMAPPPDAQGEQEVQTFGGYTEHLQSMAHGWTHTASSMLCWSRPGSTGCRSMRCWMREVLMCGWSIRWV